MGCWPSREQHDPSTEGQELLQRSHTQSSSGLRHPQAVPVPNLTRRGVLARSGARPTIPEHPDEVDDFIVSAQQASGAPKQPSKNDSCSFQRVLMTDEKLQYME